MPLTDIRVDDEGILAKVRREAVVDVLFDGRRIFSYWPQRDGTRTGGGWLMPWPEALERFLDGVTELSLVEHATGEVLFRQEVRLGSGEGRIDYVDHQGRPLALDKYFKRSHTFESSSDVEPLMAAIGRVLAALEEHAGIEGFLAYGTLLGAVREGRLLGHDNDADLGYVSRFSEPADVIGESFRIQRALAAAGYTITRYSGAAFKVDVEEADGSIRGLDVFGGFLRDGMLHLLGEIRVPFERDWIFPLGTATLEGHEFPVPADTDKLLSATYGPSWRTPDPAFHFETPPSTYRRLNGWFRGFRTGRATWDRAYHPGSYDRGRGTSPLAVWVAEREPGMGSFVDVGCGRGRDVLHMAGLGVPSLGLDFQPRSFRFFELKLREEPDPNVTFRVCNLLELRHLGAATAYAARLPGPRVMMARHLLDVVPPEGRRALWTLAGRVLREPGDRLYLEFLTRAGTDGYTEDRHLEVLDPDVVLAELAGAGATVETREDADQTVDPVAPGAVASRTCRIVARWS